jgi:hypothetical protein
MLSQRHKGTPFYIVPRAKLAPDFGILGPLWSGNVMVEDDIHLRLLPTSILDIYKVFEVHMGAPLYYSTGQVGTSIWSFGSLLK